jgi:hypothetical protein
LQFYCGQQIGPTSSPQILVQDETLLASTPTVKGTQCLIHANDNLDGQGQDVLTLGGIPAITRIEGGFNNPTTVLRGVRNISRSDSIVTALLYDGHSLCNSSGHNGPCSSPDPTPATVIGFMQLGVQETSGGDHQVHAIILNVVGCQNIPVFTPPANAISGIGSPIPVRLVQSPTP